MLQVGKVKQQNQVKKSLRPKSTFFCHIADLVYEKGDSLTKAQNSRENL